MRHFETIQSIILTDQHNLLLLTNESTLGCIVDETQIAVGFAIGNGKLQWRTLDSDSLNLGGRSKKRGQFSTKIK